MHFVWSTIFFMSSMFSMWISDNLNDGHLELVYFFVAALTMLCLVAFVKVSRSFQYKDSIVGSANPESGLSPDISRQAGVRRQRRSLTSGQAALSKDAGYATMEDSHSSADSRSRSFGEFSEMVPS